MLKTDHEILPRIRSKRRVKLLLIDAALKNHSIYHCCGGYQSSLYIGLMDHDFQPDIMVWRYNTDVMKLRKIRQTISQLRLNPIWDSVDLNQAIDIVEKTTFAKVIRQ